MRGSSGRGGVAGAAFIAALIGTGGLPDSMKSASPCLQHDVSRTSSPTSSTSSLLPPNCT